MMALKTADWLRRLLEMTHTRILSLTDSADTKHQHNLPHNVKN